MSRDPFERAAAALSSLAATHDAIAETLRMERAALAALSASLGVMLDALDRAEAQRAPARENGG